MEIEKEIHDTLILCDKECIEHCLKQLPKYKNDEKKKLMLRLIMKQCIERITK